MGRYIRNAIRALAFAATVAATPIARADDAPTSIDTAPTPSQRTASQHTLANGMRVVTSTNRRAPLVAMRIEYDAGSRDDGTRHGVAELTFRSMVDATRRVPTTSYYDWLERLGGMNGREFVSLDHAGLAITVPREAVETVLWLWSDQMGFAGRSLSEPTLARARSFVASDDRAKAEATAYGCIDGLIEDAMYPADHPYRSTKRNVLDAVTLDDVKDFYSRHYAPNHAVLSIVGDIDEPKTMALVDRYFGPIPTGSPLVHNPIPIRLSGETRIEAVAGVEAPEIVIAWPTAPFFRAGDIELDVAAALFNGNAASFLGWSLVMGKKIATQVYARQASHLLGSVFAIRVVGKQGTDPSALLAAVDDRLSHFDEMFIKRWLRSATTDLIRDRILGSERIDDRALRFALAMRATGDPGYEAKRERRLYEMTSADIASAMARDLPRDRRIVVLVKPSVGAARCGQRASSATIASPTTEGGSR